MSTERDPQSHTPQAHADCSEVLHRIFEYLDGELGPGDVLRIATHLAQCGPCLSEHDIDRTLKAVVRRSCTAEAAPATLRVSIMESITTIRLDRR